MPDLQEPRWKEILPQLITGIQQGDEVSLQLLERMATVCDYWIYQETSGYEVEGGESAMLPPDALQMWFDV